MNKEKSPQTLKNRFASIFLTLRITFSFKQIALGLAVSLVILVIPLVGYLVKSPSDAIWPATLVTQIGITILWCVIKLGAFSTTSFGFRRLGASVLNAKNNKLGAYSEKEQKKSKFNTAIEVEKNARKRGWWAPITMLIVAIPELIVVLVTSI